jgi:hypothetical protein
MKPTGAPLMAGGAQFRLTYGRGATFAPRSAGRYAGDEPGSVMNHAASEDSTSLLASSPFPRPARRRWRDRRCSTTQDRGLRHACRGGLKARERGARDPIALGGVLLPFVGLTTWLTALLTLDR